MSQLLLAGPYGWDSAYYASITLNSSEPIDEAAVTEVLVGYSCHAPAIPKILNCLRYSGHYDCYLQYSWFRSQHKQCTAALFALGVRLTINYFMFNDVKRSTP